MTKDLFVKKQCVPCHAGIPPLNQEEINTLLRELGKAWQLNKEGHLIKEYSFNDFMEAMFFANKIAALAEQEAHHPNLIIAWGSCRVEIWTHKIDGLSENDFILASKIELL
ncbi:MAG: 4a-hydroxytetrahydrobiopterin dehydratase [Chthoniobacterales bacterium]|nr:4a-hydroxytetrahydrobiopterin dehydratase [Chthoniobacterales bacterium]